MSAQTRFETTNRPIRVALMGLGKLGLSVAEGLLARDDVDIVAAVDLDPAKEGRDLGRLAGTTDAGVAITTDLPDRPGGCDAVVLMTGSRMDEVADVVAALVQRGHNVLTSAEELAYPWAEFPQQSRRLDDLARRHGVSILGAGANPGFLMDALPVVLSLATQDIRRIRISRSMDLRPHRAQRLTRFALGETPDGFARVPRSVAHGHIGFRQSIDAVADSLGLRLDRVLEQPLTPAIVTSEPRRGEFVTLEPGAVAVVRQGAAGIAAGEHVIELEEHFGFLDPADDVPEGDTYVVEGADQSFTVAVRPGVLSFVTTPAVMINLLAPLVDAPAGLRSTLDFTARELASKGRRQPTVRAVG